MQEEVEMRAVTLAISTSKLSGRLLKAAIAKVMKEANKPRDKSKDKSPTVKHGKQSLKELMAKDAGASSIEATSLRVGSFDRVARKYGVDYAVYKEKTAGDKDKYYIFFKGRDADAVSAAFKEYSANQIRKETNRPSVVAKLHKLVEQVRNPIKNPVRNKDKGLEL